MPICLTEKFQALLYGSLRGVRARSGQYPCENKMGGVLPIRTIIASIMNGSHRHDRCWLVHTKENAQRTVEETKSKIAMR